SALKCCMSTVPCRCWSRMRASLGDRPCRACTHRTVWTTVSMSSTDSSIPGVVPGVRLIGLVAHDPEHPVVAPSAGVYDQPLEGPVHVKPGRTPTRPGPHRPLLSSTG